MYGLVPPPIAGIPLIVAAGGGFKQMLVDTGIGQVVADFVASGILAPLVRDLSTGETSLLVLAIGAGFWMVKEYFSLTVGQNIKTWSLMETIISVSGLVLLLLLRLVI